MNPGEGGVTAAQQEPLSHGLSSQLTHYKYLWLWNFLEQLFEFIQPLFVGRERSLRCSETLCLRVWALIQEMWTAVIEWDR